MTRHLLPNVSALIVTAAALDVVGVLVGAAVLRLLGLGTPPPMSSIGKMISQAVLFFAQPEFQVFLLCAMTTALVLIFLFQGDGLLRQLDLHGGSRSVQNL